MRERGLEPPRLSATDSKSVVATITPLAPMLLAWIEHASGEL
jgi:hypothetical protein